MKFQTIGYFSLVASYAVIANDIASTSKNPCQNETQTSQSRTECIEYLTKRVNRFDRGKFTGRIKAKIGTIATNLLTEFLENPDLLRDLLTAGQDLVIDGDVSGIASEVGGLLDSFGGWGWGDDSDSDSSTESEPENEMESEGESESESENESHRDPYENVEVICGTWTIGGAFGPSSYNKTLGTTQNYQECIELVKTNEPLADAASISGNTTTPYSGGGIGTCYAEFNVLDLDIYASDKEIFMFDNQDIQHTTSSWQKGATWADSSVYMGLVESNHECFRKIKAELPDADGATVSSGYLCFRDRIETDSIEISNPAITDFATIQFDTIPQYFDTWPEAREKNAVPISLWLEQGSGAETDFVYSALEQFLKFTQNYQDCIDLVKFDNHEATSATIVPGLFCHADYGINEIYSFAQDSEIINFDWITDKPENEICYALSNTEQEGDLGEPLTVPPVGEPESEARCVCSNGTPSVGVNCREDLAYDCQACDDDFQLTNWQTGFAVGPLSYSKSLDFVEIYQDCIELVETEEPSADGASITTGGHCYAEFNMVDIYRTNNDSDFSIEVMRGAREVLMFSRTNPIGQDSDNRTCNKFKFKHGIVGRSHEMQPVNAP